MKEYFLRIWGGAMPKLKENLGITENYYWFETDKERQEFIKTLASYEAYGLGIDKKDGEMTHKKTVANVKVKYQDKEYDFGHDFGYEYPEEAARFMFFEGNYSCDCNLSSFIQEKCDENFPSLNCGDEIKIINFDISYVE
jgi:hypothetical protein